MKVAKSDSILAVTKTGALIKVEHLRHKFGKNHPSFSFRPQEVEPDVVPVYAGDVVDGGAEMLERCVGEIIDSLGEGPWKRTPLIARVQEITEAGARTIDQALKTVVDDGEVVKGKEGREVTFRLAEKSPE